jgi:MFS transporter, Spinster family, sphingosine-1-phosphate transporter
MTANGVATLEPSSARPVEKALPGARAALMLLLAINLFNYIDRQVLAAVEPEIREELLPGENEDTAKFKMGLLSTAFLLTYMLIAPLFGWLADRVARWLLVGIGVVLWSLASGASGWDWHIGLTAGFLVLLLTRCFVGVGEGAYGPVAPTMISDLYPIRDRGRVLAWFYLAIPVGGAVGYGFGELVNNLYGWRWAFFLVVPPGLLLGLLCFLMREPPRGQADAVAANPGRKLSMKDYIALFYIPSYLLDTLGMAAMTFAIGGLAYWMPDYLKEVEAPGLFGLGPRMTFGVITALSGLLATLLGGIVGDRLRGRYPGSYFLVSGAAMLLGFPMVLLFVNVPFPWAWAFVFLAVFCLFFNTGPTNTILANVTHPSIRASAFALNILVIHALGDAISPPIIGYIAGVWSMKLGFIVVSAFMMVGGVLWLWGARYLERDTALAPTRLAQPPAME